MNTSSLYKRRFKREDLQEYTLSVTILVAEELAGTVSREEAIKRIRKIADKFIKKYGE